MARGQRRARAEAPSGSEGTLADDMLHLWDLPPGAQARLINLAENRTYLVEAPCGFRAVLRLHRAGYHSREAIASELAWMTALERDGVIAVPRAIAGRDGALIQKTPHPGTTRFMVLFDFIEGNAPDERGDLTRGFEELGSIAARCHAHALGWRRPEGFTRLTWDAQAVFGPAAPWGDWRDAPGVSAALRPLLEQAERRVRARLDAYGKAPERFTLIHADMRLANLLIGPEGTRLIDFDDCGMGWLIYDFAAAISFMEDDPRIPALKSAWLRGYRSVRPLNARDEAEIDTMVMLRRMALLAWIGSHMDATEPQALAPHFADCTAKLARAWLARQP